MSDNVALSDMISYAPECPQKPLPSSNPRAKSSPPKPGAAVGEPEFVGFSPLRSTGLNDRVFEEVAKTFGLNMPDAVADILRVAEIAVAEERPPLRSTADVLAHVRRHHPRAEFLGVWIADAVLARKLGWPIPLPLLASGLGRRSFGQGEEFSGVAIAYARAAAAAVDLHGELARRAATLMATAPRLRAKGAGAVVTALLDDDAVAPAARLGGMSDRGMRRLCDRLVTLGAVRELTGRPTFRLYGL
jgi:hypothetical protein